MELIFVLNLIKSIDLCGCNRIYVAGVGRLNQIFVFWTNNSWFISVLSLAEVNYSNMNQFCNPFFFSFFFRSRGHRPLNLAPFIQPNVTNLRTFHYNKWNCNNLNRKIKILNSLRLELRRMLLLWVPVADSLPRR